MVRFICATLEQHMLGIGNLNNHSSAHSSMRRSPMARKTGNLLSFVIWKSSLFFRSNCIAARYRLCCSAHTVLLNCWTACMVQELPGQSSAPVRTWAASRQWTNTKVGDWLSFITIWLIPSCESFRQSYKLPQASSVMSTPFNMLQCVGEHPESSTPNVPLGHFLWRNARCTYIRLFVNGQ